MISTIVNYYNRILYDYADQRTIGYPLCGSPVPPFTLLILYAWFVMSYGKQFMKDRPAYELKAVIQLYNVLQIATNAVMFLVASYVVVHLFPNFKCMSRFMLVDLGLDTVGVFFSWVYYINKFMDLLDTVFFVLRKKFHLITTLHLYHHISMAFIGYFVMHYGYPLGEVAIIGYLNTLVHTFMYYYYYIRISKKNKVDNLWWKKYITQLQLCQFSIFTVWFTLRILFVDCTNIYPKFLMVGYLAQSLIMMFMFGQYYYQAFVKPQNVKQQ